MVLSTLESEETGTIDNRRYAKVLMDYTVVDAESGESVHSRMAGYAEDSNDKALYKAITGANKYFYLKFLGIPTNDDPEADDVNSQRSNGNQAGKKPIPTMVQEKTYGKSMKTTVAASNASRLAERIYQLIENQELTEEEVQRHTDPELDRPYRQVIDEWVRKDDTKSLTALGLRLRQYAESRTPVPVEEATKAEAPKKANRQAS
jgi:PDZ domain-containing secreted protein